MRANERRMRLIEELCERKFDTIDNLAFELGVSRRTICYDIEELIEVRQEQSAETVAQSTESVREEAKEARTATAESVFSIDDIFEEECVHLTPETAPFPFAFDDEPQPEKQNPSTVRMTRKDLFEQLYAQTADLPRKDRKVAIFTAMLPYFDDDSRAESYVNMQFERKLRNLICRRVRLTRKVNLQEFNYFCTITYFYGHYISE